MAYIRIPDLLPGSVYNFQVRSKDDSQASEWSQVFSTTVPTDTFIPATPTNPSWVVSGDSFHAEWDAVTTNTNTPTPDTIPITRYEVELVANSTTKILSVSPVTGEKPKFDLSFETNRALFGAPRPVVTFRVRAVDNKELKSAWTTVISQTNPAPLPPTAPAVGAVATGVPAGIKLAWTNSTSDDIIRYHIYSGTTAGFTPSTSNRVYAGLSNPFTFSTLTYTTQYFKIFSVDKFEQESTTSLDGNAAAIDPFSFDTTPPADITGFSVTISNDPNGVLLTQRASATWSYDNADTSIKGFQIQYKKTTDTSWRTVSVMKDNLTFPYVITTGLDPNVAYSFRVRSYNQYANYSTWINYGTSATPTTGAEPTLFYALEIGGGGYIQSQDYDGVEGNFGFYLDDNELNINNGHIRGETITVGSIRSSLLAVYPDGTTIPGKYRWQIDLDGDAILGNTWVRGSLVVGEGSETKTSVVQSYGYSDTITSNGWIIRSNGSARFNSVDADTLSGESIKAGTLVVDKLATGSLVAGIELSSAQGIYTTGILGQTVRMSQDGFNVVSPPYARITNISITSPSVYLTVDVANSFVAGNWVRVMNLPAFVSSTDIYQVVDVDGTGTIIHIEVPGSSSIGGTAVQGQLWGGLTGAGKTQDVLVDFPADGIRPNIVSGTLTGDTILAKENLVVFEGASVEAGATLTLSAGIKNPTTAVTLGSTLESTEVATVDSADTDIAGGNSWIPIATNHEPTGNDIYTLSVAAWEDAVTYHMGITVHKYDVDTRVVTQVMPKTEISTYTKSGGMGGGYNVDGANIRGLVFNDGYWWFLEKVGGKNAAGTSYKEVIYLVRLNPTGWTYTKYMVKNNASGAYFDWMIGKDHTVATGLVIGLSAVVNSSADYEISTPLTPVTRSSTEDINAYSFSTTSGVPPVTSGLVTIGTPLLLNDFGLSGTSTYMRSIVKGAFDYGATKYVLKSNGGGAADHIWYHVWNTSGTREPNLEWATTSSSTGVLSFYWNTVTSKFNEMRWNVVTNQLVKVVNYEYAGGSSLWTDTNGSKVHWVGYSWYDSVATTQETQIGGIKSYTLPKRRYIQTTIPAIPYRGTSDYPDRARVWVVQSTTQPVITSSTWKMRGEIFYPSTSATIKMNVAPPADVPKTTNEFASSGAITPAQIISSDSGSYWKADNTAQFLKLNITSAGDATTAAGNTPPLKIGPPAGTHMRIDGNEIIAMTSDTVQGNLLLNATGTVSLGTGTAIRGVRMGARLTANTDANSRITVNHNLGTDPGVTALARSNHFLRLFSSSTTQAVFTVYTPAGALVGSGVTVTYDYIAIAD